MIQFPQQKVTSLRIEFLSSYPDSPNPGAAEIAVYNKPVSEKLLAEMQIPPEEKTPEAKALRREMLDGKLGFRNILVVKRKPLNISHVYVYHVEGFRPGGGLYVVTPTEDGCEEKCIFDAGDGMITTADLSYDGKQVVFALRRGGHVGSNPVAHIEDISRYEDEKANYHIFRINIDGTGLEQLTHGTYNNLDPCWLPDGGIAFISDRKPAYAYCYVVTSPVLYRMEADGSQQKRLSANYLMDFTPSALDDGRIIYTRWEYVDRAACPIQSLWAINPDGTGLTGFYGNRVISPGTFMDAQPVPGTGQILATATNHNGSCRGGIVAIDPSKGANAPEAVRNLTPDVDIYAHRLGGGPWGNGMLDCRIGGTYEKPLPISEDRFLVSKGGTLQLRDFDANATSLVFPDGSLGYYCPMPIRPTKQPPVVAGTIMDRTVDLPEDGSVSGSWATVFMQDVYNGLEPDVKRGEIKQVAVVQEIEKSTHTPQNNERPDGPGMRNIAVFGFQFPLVSCGATYAPKKLWGFADVNEDGSAAFQVPSEVPIYFLALDGEGRALQRMRSFTHMMPGEVQGCVGCHADRTSVTAHRGTQLGMQGKVQKLQTPEWGVKGFSYQEVVQGVFDRNCVECHNEREQPKGVDLTGDMTDFFNVSYDILCRTGTQAENNWIRHGSPSGPGIRPRSRHEPLHRMDLDHQRRRAQHTRHCPTSLGQPRKPRRRDHPHRPPRRRRQTPRQRFRRRSPPRLLVARPQCPLLRHLVFQPQGPPRQPADDAPRSRLNAPGSCRPALQRLPQGRHPAEVLHPGHETGAQQLPPRPARRNRRRHPEVWRARVPVDERSRLSEDPQDLRTNPRLAEAAPPGGHGRVHHDVRLGIAPGFPCPLGTKA